MRNILFILLICCSTGVYAQQNKINFLLKSALVNPANQNKDLSIIVRGNVIEIKKEVLVLGGTTGLSSGNIVQVKLPVSSITTFSMNKSVQSIEYSGSKMKVLNDTSAVNNNVVPIWNGDAPLIQPYTGKGVVFGLIDTGIDIHHNDFKDSLGNTRILRVWDQNEPDNGSSTYGYGVIWDSTSINNGTSTHEDPMAYSAHGTHVCGTGAGNGLAVNNYKGVAPDANIVVVSIDFGSNESVILDAVDYIYKVADSLGMPCVINLSLGDYPGSHDGTDGTAVLIDSLLNAKPGRALVCATGNAGSIPFHLQHQVNSDTTFTWFKYNPTSLLGYGAVFYEIWADTADLNNVSFSIGANLPSGSFGMRGSTPFDNIQNRLGLFTDTIKNNGNILAIIDTYGELQGDKYMLQIHAQEPDSNAYYYSLMTTGSGKLDIWSHTNAGITGSSEIVKTGLPTAAVYPNIIHYQEPDTSQTIVGSFTCLPTVIAVGSYRNRKTYLDVDSIVRTIAGIPGEIDLGSSIGPNRRGIVKPEVSSPGRYVMSTASDSFAAYVLGAAPQYLGVGGKHVLKNGTSMASPSVAGIVALYLEKCPNATMAEIRNAVLTTAKQDGFTGVVPNNSYGYGKSDAFSALNNSNYSFSIGSDQEICEGDSVQISSPAYSSYEWLNGDSTQNIYIDTNEFAYVTVTNTSGCKSISDTVNVIWHPLPLKPTITVVGNDTLVYASNLSLQWYFNSNTLGGETDTLHLAQNNGDYFVQVTDSFGCVNNSDTASIIILGIENSESELFSVFPNPTKGSVRVELEQDEIQSIEVVNLLGKVLMVKKVQNNQSFVDLNISNFSDGVYYIRVNTEDDNYLRKLILLR